MKFEQYKKQVVSTACEAMNIERTIYNDLIEECPEEKYEYALMKRASIEGIARGVIAMVGMSEYSFAQTQSGMIQLDRLEITLHWKGRDLIPLIGNGKIYYIQAKYLKPYDDDMLLSYYLRDDPASASPMIGVQEGMCLAGLIMPIVIEDKVFCESLYRMYDLTKREVYGGSEL